MFPIGPYFRCEESMMTDAPTVMEIGVFELVSVRAVLARWPKAKYVCVEPSSVNYATLCRAVAESGLPESHDLTTLQRALSYADGPMPFYDFGHEQWASGFPRHETEGKSLKGTETVQGCTLRSLLDVAAVERCDLLLLNCEGAERFAMRQLGWDPGLSWRVTQFSSSSHCRHIHIYPQSDWDSAVAALAPFYGVQSHEPVPNIPYYLFTRKP